VPVILSLVISLVVGTIFSGKPRLGIVDHGESQIRHGAHEMSSLRVKEYDTEDDLKEATGRGAVDVGMILPAGFDDNLVSGEVAEITVYVWGESLLKNRANLLVAIMSLLRDVAGQESPIEIVTDTVGDDANIPWEDRLLPLVMIVTVFIGGFLIPASSLVEEKTHRTLTAVSTTPASLGEIFVAKGLLGVLLSIVMGVVILVMNSAFGARPGLLVLVLALGSILAVLFGLLMGASTKDITTLFGTMKALGIFLYAPAILYMFPDLPDWIGYLFPTYYIIAPVVEISLEGASWADIALEMFVLVGIIAVMVMALGVVANRLKLKEV
jgi:ABC-2 type transport system permease protein